jgi:nuclear GTP-binding protein
VGKSSLINSLKRERAVGVGATPGYTRAMQEVHIDKHVKLLDCPGIVFSESSSESDLVLRNCIKVEQITDTVKPGTSPLHCSSHPPSSPLTLPSIHQSS